MRLGLWGARGDRRGLHIQGGEFARHMKPTKVFAFDIRSIPSSHLPCDWTDYDGSELTVVPQGRFDKASAQQWMEGLDVVWACETFYHDDFPTWAAELGVATVMHCNPEFYRFDVSRDTLPRPTIELMPSRWRLDKMTGTHQVLECPVATDRLTYRHRPMGDQLTFLHVVGGPAVEDRNGTQALMEALEYVRRPCRLIVRAQRECGVESGQVGNVAVELIDTDVPNYWDLYDEGDVLVMPRRYGGQCLPVREALACGLPFIMPCIEPQRGWEWPGWLFPASDGPKLKTQGGMVTVHQPDVMALARMMDTLSADPMKVAVQSLAAKHWAMAHSWEACKPAYDEVIGRAAEMMRA